MEWAGGGGLVQMLFFIISLMIGNQVWAATISVNNLNIAANSDGKCSLFEAIQAANKDSAIDGCPAGNGADVIELQANKSYTQNFVLGLLPSETLVDMVSREAKTLLIVESDITINGHNATLTKTGDGLLSNGGFFVVQSTGKLTLNDLIIHNMARNLSGGFAIRNTGGTLIVNHCSLSTTNGYSNSSVIFSQGGQLIVTNSTIGATQKSNGSGITTIDATKAKISNCKIEKNTFAGIRNDGSSMEIRNSAIRDNGSVDNHPDPLFAAGGIENSGILTISNSVISGNTGVSGGGIFNSGQLTLINSTVSNNSSIRWGGGISNVGSTTKNVELVVLNSTITGNKTGTSSRLVKADVYSGGIYNHLDPSSTYYAVPGTVELINTIVAGNSEISPFPVTTHHPDVSGPITGNYNNLIGDLSGATGTIGTGSDIINPNPLLDTLKANGGFTETHALLPGSPAINAGDNTICASAEVNNFDQRGESRTAAGNCDIGAFEKRSENPQVVLKAMAYPYEVCKGQNFEVTFGMDTTSQVDSMKVGLNVPDSLTLKTFDCLLNGATCPVSGTLWVNPTNSPISPAKLPASPSINLFKVSFTAEKVGTSKLQFSSYTTSEKCNYDEDIGMCMGYSTLTQTNKELTLKVVDCSNIDGVSDNIEDASPNNGDGNGDGILDRQQNNVTSLPSVVTGDYLTLEVTPATCTTQNVASKTEQAAGNGNEDPSGDYPQGLLEFAIPCDTATAKIFYHGIPVENVSGTDVITVNASQIPLTSLDYRKYGPMPPSFGQSSINWYDLSPKAQFGKTTIGGKTILTASFTLEDGELGDDTGKDSTIYDIGGLIIPESVTVPKSDRTAHGTLNDDQGNPIAGVTIEIDGKTATTDALGNWEINGLVDETTYTVTASKEGYTFAPTTVDIGNETMMTEVTITPLIALKMVVKPSTYENLKQGEDLTYTMTIINGGTQTATGVTLSNVLPEGATLVALESIEGQCNAETLVCSLPDLTPGATAEVKLTLHNDQTKALKTVTTLTSNEYPVDMKASFKAVKPHLSVTLVDTPDPVVMQSALHYQAVVELSALAPEDTATGIKLTMQLPTGTELVDVTTKYGKCDSSAYPVVSCQLDDLSIATPDSISRAVVDVNVKLTDASLLILTHEAKVWATNYPAHTDRERTNIVVPPNAVADVVLVVDTTESMNEELNGIIKATEKFIQEQIGKGGVKPKVALIEFKDNVTLRAFTSEMDVLLKSLRSLTVEGGGLCPEASAEALYLAVNHTKQGGVIVFSTDASPYPDADIVTLAERIREKGIVLDALISGDCTTGQQSWNDVKSK